MTITIKTDFINEEESKKSRFICHLKRISTEEEALFIAKIKKEHWKANHNCSAYTLGDRQEIQRTSDDGEPSGTAGVPMLEILKKKEIINVCAVVTRYFGGIKLGQRFDCSLCWKCESCDSGKSCVYVQMWLLPT
ncbi:IMPACT family member YigZ [Lactococcus lactis]|nr:IMPACT family member YigZ [Lactococcus lactis]